MPDNLDRKDPAEPQGRKKGAPEKGAGTNDNKPGKPVAEMPVDTGRSPLDVQSWVLIAIGIAFLVGGFAVYFGMADVPADRHNLTLLISCIGFAIVLTEIGTRAAVQHSALNTGVVVTGAGALALLFYVLVNPLALCQFGYGERCPRHEAIKEFGGTVRVPGGELDPRALTVAVFPQTRSSSQLGQNVITWTAKFPVRVDGQGNVEEPKHVVLSYRDLPPVNHPIPEKIDSDTHMFPTMLEFQPSDQTEETSSDDPAHEEVRLEQE